LQRVESPRLLRVRHVDVDEIGAAARGDVRNHTLHEIAVRIEQRDAFTGGDILDQHGFQERRLAGTGLTHDVYVRQSVGMTDTKRASFIPERRPAKERNHESPSWSRAIRRPQRLTDLPSVALFPVFA